MILHGDCLTELKRIDENSIDAIVTDPPYGLSDAAKREGKSLFDIYLNVMLPDLYDVYSKAFGGVEFPGPRNSVSFLDHMLRTIGEKARIGMPERPVDLKSCATIGKVEVKDAGISPLSVSDRILSNEADASGGEGCLNFTLKLRPLWQLAVRDSLRGSLRKPGSGLLIVPVVIPHQSCFASFLGTLSPSGAGFLADSVRFCNDTLRDVSGPTGVMANAGAELRAMLSIDLRSGAAELLPAHSTSEDAAVFELIPSEFIRTGATASRLSSKFKSCPVRVIGDAANRTFSIDLHKDLLSEVTSTRGGFMGKKWDYDVPSVEVWRECLRVLKPGGHLLAFGGPRTYHRLAVNIEDAGFEIRDQIQWLFGSGFPKSYNVAQAIEKKQTIGRARRKDRDLGKGRVEGSPNGHGYENLDTGGQVELTTEAAKQWAGWGTALKPANEPICMARKPLSEKTVAANVLKWGTGGLNIDGCRIETEESIPAHHSTSGSAGKTMGKFNDKYKPGDSGKIIQNKGRFPANLILDEEAAALLDEQSGTLKSGGGTKRPAGTVYGNGKTHGKAIAHYAVDGLGASEGGASRFFYVAKVSSSERGDSKHPTMKPLKLMRYLCKLITPPNGLVLDPFAGSGSTGVAALQEGFQFLGIEREAEYVEIARKRITYESPG